MPLRMERAPASPQIGARVACLLPVLTTLAAALLALQPVPLPGYAGLTPAFTLMAVYHWAIYRPDLLPPVALFAIGVGCDLLCGGPPGLTPLLLLISRAAVLRCRRWFINRTFAYVWAGFSVLSGAAIFGMWALNCALSWRLFSVDDSVFRAALTITLFPIASFLLGRTQHTLMEPG
jgi:rod shape-determining protein MreD